MIELFLLANLAVSEPNLNDIADQINGTVEKPDESADIESLINRFGAHCDGFYGCSVNYPGAEW